MTRLLILFTMLATLLGCASTTTTNESFSDVTNLREPQEDVYSSAQPTEAQFEAMAAAGVRHIINLRPAAEQQDFDEARLVQSLGMSYHHIPVAGIGDVTAENAGHLNALLQDLDGPVLVHCASGNRVGALRAVTAVENGATVDEALATGARWGLTGMSPAVREILTD